MERIRNRSRSESTSHHEVDERFLEERVVECRAKALVPGLQTLSKLCCYSRSICKMITAGCDEIHEAMDTCVEEIDPSAPITVSLSQFLCLLYLKQPSELILIYLGCYMNTIIGRGYRVETTEQIILDCLGTSSRWPEKDDE